MPYIEKSIVMNECLGYNYFEDWSTENATVEKLVKLKVFEVHSFSYKLLTHA